MILIDFSQLRNPFFSIWTTDLGTNIALGFIILGGLVEML
jgi:hypothetical protein